MGKISSLVDKVTPTKCTTLAERYSTLQVRLFWFLMLLMVVCIQPWFKINPESKELFNRLLDVALIVLSVSTLQTAVADSDKLVSSSSTTTTSTKTNKEETVDEKSPEVDPNTDTAVK